MSSTLVYGKNAPIVTCSNCECQFKYSTVDIFIDNAMGGDGQFVRCPECGQVNPATTQYFDPRGDDQFNPSETYPNMGVGKDDQGNIITETYATKVALQEEITAREEVDTEIYSKFNSAISSIQYSTDANDITRLSYTTFDSSPNTAIDIIINKATTTTSGLMPKEAVQEIADLSERVADLEGPTRRYLYTGSDNPTAEDINTFAISEGLSAPFSGIAVVVASTLHIWHYYTNGGWRDDGKDTVQTANQTTLGIVMGSTDNGKVFVETDGTMSLNGYDDITQNISDINSNIANIETTKANTSDLDNYVDLTTNQAIHGLKCFVQDNVGHSILQVENQETGSVIEFGSTRISRKESSDGDWRSIQVPYIDGVMATTNDITTSLSNYVTLNTTQTITAQKYFTTTEGVGAIIIQSGDERLFSDGTQISYTSPNVSKSVAFNAGGNGTYRLYFPEQNGTLSTLNDITTSLSNYVSINGANYLSGTYRFDRYDSQPDAQISLFNVDTTETLLLTESSIGYRVGGYYNQLFFDTPTENTDLHVPNKSGTIATTDDITTSLSNYATLDTVQTFTERKNFRAFGTNIPLSVFNNEEDKYLYLHPTYLSTYDGVTLNSFNLYFPNTSGTLATTEAIANSYVTLNTSQWVGGTKHFGIAADSNYPIQIHHNVNPNDVVRFGLNSIVYSTEEDGESTLSYPNKSGTIALIEDITETVQPIEEQVEELSTSVNDIYQILQQEVYTSQDIEQEYSSRETADGADIIDGALETVKKIQGATVKPIQKNQFNILAVDTYGGSTTANTIRVNTTTGVLTIPSSETITRASMITLGKLSSLIPNASIGETYTIFATYSGLDGNSISGSIEISNGSRMLLQPRGVDGSYKSTFTIESGDIGSETELEIYLNDRIISGTSNVRIPIFTVTIVIMDGNHSSEDSPVYSPYIPGLKNAYFQGLQSTGRNLYTYAGVENNADQFANCTEVEVLDGGNVVIARGNDGASDFAYSSGWVRLHFENEQYYSNLYKVANVNISADITLLEQGPRLAEVRCYLNFFNNIGDITEKNQKAITSTKTRYTWTFSLTNSGLAYPVFAINSNKVRIENISISYTEETDGYEPYVSHEISLPEPVELAKWDSIDLVRGKRIVQSNTLTFDGTESWSVVTANENFFFYVIQSGDEALKRTSLITNKLNVDEPNNTTESGCYFAGDPMDDLIFFFLKTAYPDLSTVDAWKQQLAAWNTAGDPLTVCYQTATATESDISMEDRLPAYKNGSEMVIQGDTDNSEYGAETTLTQNYAEVRGTTEGGN